MEGTEHSENSESSSQSNSGQMEDERSTEANRQNAVKNSELRSKEETEKVSGNTKVSFDSMPEQMDDVESSERNESGSPTGTGKSVEGYKIRRLFRRPPYAVRKHPIFSSPFAKRISLRAFGPKKPKWYRSLDSTQLFLFKDILNLVEVGRQGYFNFEEFLERLQDLDSSITRAEVLNIIDSMEVDEFEEFDFGKFLFLLAYGDEASSNYSKNNDDILSSKKVTRRQSLLLSAIANFVLITSIEDIERYYSQNSRRKSTVLHNHLEATKLEALSEAAMEVKQRKANKHLAPLFALTGSPYARPVPFVTRFTKGKIYQEWKKSKYSLPIIGQSVSKPLVPPEVKPKLGENVLVSSESQKILSKMNYGRIPLPTMRFPEEKIKQMRKGCTVELKDYIMEKAFDAIKKSKAQLKKAALLYAKRGLLPLLQQGFPTKKDKDIFIDVYQRYLPLQESDMKDFSLWVSPSGYEAIQFRKTLKNDTFTI